MIVGFVSQGQGIKVHRDCCPNILNKKRLVYVEWDERKPDIKYAANIKVIANDRNFLLTDLVTCISQFKASLTGVNVSVDQETLTATALISIMIEDKEHLDNIISNLKKVSSVIDVSRTIK